MPWKSSTKAGQVVLDDAEAPEAAVLEVGVADGDVLEAVGAENVEELVGRKVAIEHGEGIEVEGAKGNGDAEDALKAADGAEGEAVGAENVGNLGAAVEAEVAIDRR